MWINNKKKTYPVKINTIAANVVNIGQALFDLESDIGERSKNEIKAALKGVKEIKDKYKERKAEIEKECLSQEYKDKLYENVMKRYNELQEKRKKAKKIIVIISIIVLFATALLIATSK